MAILNEVRKIAQALGVETDSQDITTMLNAIAVVKGGEATGHNVQEAAEAVAKAMATSTEEPTEEPTEDPTEDPTEEPTGE